MDYVWSQTMQVNAKDVFDIERFDPDETKKVVVGPADNEKYYKNFYHVMSHQWQEEVLGLSQTLTSSLQRTQTLSLIKL